MADSYFDVAASAGALRASLIANGGGSGPTHYHVYRLATGTHSNDLEDGTIRSLQYVRITAADGASPVVQCTNDTGLFLYYGENWTIDANVEWRPTNNVGSTCFQVQNVQGIVLHCVCRMGVNSGYVVKAIEPWYAIYEFDGTVIGANSTSTGHKCFYGQSSNITGTWNVHNATIADVAQVLHAYATVTAYVKACSIQRVRQVTDQDSARTCTVECDNNDIRTCYGGAAEGVFNYGATTSHAGRLRVRGNTLKGATGKALVCNISGSLTEVTVAGNILLDVTYGTDTQIGKTNFSSHDNAARSCAYNGGAGTNDATVTGPAVVGFVDEGGGDLHLDRASAGVAIDHVTGTLGLSEDKDGVARPQGTYPDAGCYEAFAGNCGVDGVDQLNASAAGVDFVAADGGNAKPAQASAEDEGNWSATGDLGGLLGVVDVTRLSDYRYSVTFDRMILPGEVIEVDASAVETDQGGHCDSPGTGGFTSAYGGLAALARVDATHLRVTCVSSGGAPTAPDEASAEQIVNWVISSDGNPLAVVGAVLESTWAILLEVDRSLASGETITVESAVVLTVGDGELSAPGVVEQQMPYVNAGIESITQVGRRVLEVTFAPEEGGTAEPLEASAEDEGNWTVTTDCGVALGIVSVVKGSYLVTLDRDLIPGEVVTLDASAVETDQGGYCDSPGTGVIGIAIGAEPRKEGPLEALTGSLGDALARLIGRPTTRLRRPLGRTDTIAYVESTLACPDAGTLRVRGEVIPYTSRVHNEFRGLVRSVDNAVWYEAPGLAAHQAGTLVMNGDEQFSVMAQARNDLHVGTCDAAVLDALCRDLGYGRVLTTMSDDDLREYAQARYYLDASWWWALYRVLRPILRHYTLTGVGTLMEDGGLWLPLAGVETGASAQLADRWIEIGDERRVCRVACVREVEGVVQALLTAFSGPHWREPGHEAGESVAWRLMPFAVQLRSTGDGGDGLAPAADLRVVLYTTAAADAPGTYLMADASLVEDDRQKAGKLLADENVPGVEDDPESPNFGEMKAGLYLINPLAAEVRTVLREVIAAGVRFDVFSLPGP